MLSPAEVFYARPSVSVAHWMQALGAAAAAVQQQAAGGLAQPGDRGGLAGFRV